MNGRWLRGLLVLLALGWLATSLMAAPTTARTDCPRGTPFAPQPADGMEVPRGDLMLRWTAFCASAFEVQINGTPIASLQATSVVITPQAGDTIWRVSAIFSDGSRADGPTWRFTVDSGGWLATPLPLPTGTRLYIQLPVLTAAPLFDLSAPTTVIALTCASTCAGILFIGAFAWLLGLRAQQRTAGRLRNK